VDLDWLLKVAPIGPLLLAGWVVWRHWREGRYVAKSTQEIEDAIAQQVQEPLSAAAETPPASADTEIPLDAIRDIRCDFRRDNQDTTTWGDIAYARAPRYVQGRRTERWTVDVYEAAYQPTAGYVRLGGRRMLIERMEFSAAVDGPISTTYELVPAEEPPDDGWQARLLAGVPVGATFSPAPLPGTAAGTRVVRAEVDCATGQVVGNNGLAVGVATHAARAGELVEVTTHGVAPIAVAGAAANDAMVSMQEGLDALLAAFRPLDPPRRGRRTPRAPKPEPPEPTIRAKGRALDLED
jgi:hypothetical protein